MPLQMISLAIREKNETRHRHSGQRIFIGNQAQI
jgi:hypothetical protein